ncbi:MAG: YggS family pyridoxal phosphate-dependent enzyme [Oscillospiraceae bacterium]|nr:YggS family pyridoxal phosphate-dependent enzyme [Oscillospiraceae bacterium]
MFEHITENYRLLHDEIAAVCAEAGRDPSDVRLMAVTKTVPPDAINHAISLGIDLIGENRVQELAEKRPLLNLSGVELHLIGHLQTNKVRAVVPGVDCVQSADSVRLAREISKCAVMAGITQPVLAEVNIGGEESKFGFAPNELLPALAEIALLPGVRIDGLMTVAPFTQNSDDNRTNFAALRRIFLDIAGEKLDNIHMHTLSMGMSSDFREAVAAGSTLVRVGSALFGQRTVR